MNKFLGGTALLLLGACAPQQPMNDQQRGALLQMMQNSQQTQAQQQQNLWNVVRPLPPAQAPIATRPMNCTTTYVQNQAYTNCY